MVLFQEDYYKPIVIKLFDKPVKLFPRIHQNTKNNSFVRTCMLLQRMGIKNYMFPLALYQPELMGVDPHDEANLTTEQKFRIACEIKINPWYYFREVVRIPTTGSKPISFILNRANTALIWCFYNNVDVGLVQPRQTGKTMGVQGIVSHVMYFLGFNFDIAMLTKDGALVQDNVNRLKDIRDSLPSYLLERDKADTERKEGLSYEALQNKYLTFTNSNDPMGAIKIGRGMTSPVQHWDEIAYFKYIWISFPSALAATTTAARNAAEAGLPCSNLYTTTAGRPDTQTGAYAMKLMLDACRFHEKLYDSRNKEEFVKTVTSNSFQGKKMVYCVFSHRQLGFDDEWLREVTIRNNATQDEIDRDYLNIWKAGSENGAIPAELLDRISNSLIEPLYVDISDSGYIINWYISEAMLKSPEYKNRPFVVGMDSSEQIGRDYTTLVIIDPYDMGVVATMRCNESNILHLSKRVADLMLQFPRMILIPECKSTGVAITDYVISTLKDNGVNPWLRIFNLAVQKKDEPEYRDFNLYTEPTDGLNKKLFGFRTTGGVGIFSRNMLYKATMLKALQLNHSRIHDEVLIMELRQLALRNGKIDHAEGGHDDLIISYLLACFFIFFGKNLNLYGIDRDTFLNKLTEDENGVNKIKKQEQLEIRSRIRLLEDRIRRAPSSLVRISYERELTNLQLYLDDSIMGVKPIADMQIGRDSESISTVSKGTTEEGIREFSRIIVPNAMNNDAYTRPQLWGGYNAIVR